MSKRRTAYEIATSGLVQIDPMYSMRSSDVVEIEQNSNGSFEAIAHSFKYSYYQGVKAEKARLRVKRR